MGLERDVERIGAIAAVPTILDVVARTTGLGFTAIARVTEDRWITCASRDELAFGLKPGDELKVETTICHEIRQSREPVIIDEVSTDAVYCRHHTPAQYGFQSYISMPIILSDGSFFGTLCAIDPKPRKLRTPEVIGMFKLFADLIAFHLDAADKVTASDRRARDADARVVASEGLLASEKQTAELREKFVAVLGHDLRNPLASIAAGVRLLRKKADTESSGWLDHMQASVTRMAGLIDNVMDFTRARLGGGLHLTLTDAPLEPVIAHIVSEFQGINPGRVIVAAVQVPGTVRIDAGRMAQLLSNLLGNALSYGAPDEPIEVTAKRTETGFAVSVRNKGAPISDKVKPLLFTAFQRGDVRPEQQGLGLGLYISSEIARAHGGSLSVTSTQDETVFTAEFPQPR